MYNLRYYNPRLSGNIYRWKRRCGKSNCRCAKDKKYWHPFYVLEYHQRIDSQWKRKREYIKKSEVKALRQKIKRAKERDKAMQNQTRKFLSQMPKLIRRIQKNPCDVVALDSAKKLIETLNPKPITRLEGWQRVNILVNLLCAMLNPYNSKHQQELT